MDISQRDAIVEIKRREENITFWLEDVLAKIAE
jgi:hypothetical protein